MKRWSSSPWQGDVAAKGELNDMSLGSVFWTSWTGLLIGDFSRPNEGIHPRLGLTTVCGQEPGYQLEERSVISLGIIEWICEGPDSWKISHMSFGSTWWRNHASTSPVDTTTQGYHIQSYLSNWRSGGSCGIWVRQRWYRNVWHWPANTRNHNLIDPAWSYRDNPWNLAIPGPLPISSPPRKDVMQNPTKANNNGNRHS